MIGVVVAAGGAAVAGAVTGVVRSHREQSRYVTDLDRDAVPSTLRGQGVRARNEHLLRGVEPLRECDPGVPLAHHPHAPVVEGVALHVTDTGDGS